MKRSTPKTIKGRRLAVVMGFLVALVGAETAAAPFPEYPLQTGTGSIPPNIMFILDDSGSMAWDFMPGAYAGDRTTLNNRTDPLQIGARTSVHNKLYYDPSVTYRPWMQANATRHSGGETASNVYTNTATLTGDSTLANRSEDERTYYVPKTAGVNVNDSSQYYRFQVRQVGGSGGLRVVRSEYLRATGDNRGLAQAGCDATSVGNLGWRQCQEVTPTATRNASAEIANFATWYSYHRTRSKVAKAGAAEAFGQLGENFRVGYDSIWNRNGSSSVTGNLPAFQIPVQGNDEGLFKGANRTSWFDYIFRANASGGTPLHGALRRTGQYYETQTGASGAWGPQAGDAQLSCRQSYAILTTDGYWNDDDNFASSVRPGDADSTDGVEIVSADGQTKYRYRAARPFRDDVGNTLADVAMHYWKRDLRTNLANNVPSSSANPAFWQHMSTFGISIGLEGTLSLDDVQLIEQGSESWPNPWRTTGSNQDSWSNESARRIDDLMHAAVNGHGSFVAATNPQEFADALKDSLAMISRRRSSGSNVASNGPSLNNGSHLFQATYTSGEWAGDVVGISIVGGAIANMPSWSMAAIANENAAAFASRPVYTWGSSGAKFPTPGQVGALVRNAGLPTEVSGNANANYIKGSRSGEGSSPSALRRRVSPVGDIVNSSPFYVAETDDLFIGANDGMLHAVDASNGTTLFSYVPKGLNFNNLGRLSSQDYTHRFFVDGGIDVTTRAQGKNRNILVASLGRGGKGVFALDVTQTDPAQISNSIVRWDRTFQKSGDTDYDADMGHVLGAPLVRQGNNGKTIAIVPNGIDSANGQSVLFVYVLNDNGSLDSTIRIPTNTDGTAAQPNGLSEARAADVNGDGKADYIYAGDLHGNLWKFDISDSNTNKWDVAYKQGNSGRPIFQATGPSSISQPITAAVALAKHPVTGRIFVMFGTGSYVTNGDLTSTGVQTLYSIIDEGAYPITKTQLQHRTIPVTGVDSLGRAARAWEPYSALADGKRGWYVNLGVPSPASDGERVVTAPFVRGRALWFSSIIPIPGEGCDAGGTGYLNAVDAFTGTNPRMEGGSSGTFIDVNQDGVGNDRIAGQTGTGEAGFITSVDLGIGMPSQGIGVGNAIYVCGSDAECGRAPTPPGSGGPARLQWHEVVAGE
ncbi:pilus assembly protein [Luteimonas sp. A537]